MKEHKNKGAMGILSLFLWAVLLTVIARLLTHHGGWDFSGILFKVVLWIMQCIAIFFCWWIFMGLRLNRFIKRLNEAGYTYGLKLLPILKSERFLRKNPRHTQNIAQF